MKSKRRPISFSLNKEEVDYIDKRARKEGMIRSEYMRYELILKHKILKGEK